MGKKKRRARLFDDSVYRAIEKLTTKIKRKAPSPSSEIEFMALCVNENNENTRFAQIDIANIFNLRQKADTDVFWQNRSVKQSSQKKQVMSDQYILCQPLPNLIIVWLRNPIILAYFYFFFTKIVLKIEIFYPFQNFDEKDTKKSQKGKAQSDSGLQTDKQLSVDTKANIKGIRNYSKRKLAAIEEEQRSDARLEENSEPNVRQPDFFCKSAFAIALIHIFAALSIDSSASQLYGQSLLTRGL